MTDYTIPRANAPIAGTEAPTTQWYNFIRYLDTRTASAAGDVQAEITVIAEKLGSPDGTVDNIPPLGNVTSVQGKQSIASSGIGVVQLRLVNDADTVDAVSFYGTDSAGVKGWNFLYDAFDDTANIEKINTSGIVSFDLTDLSDSGTGALLATTFDAKGRKTGTKAATITGTAGRVTVANGDAVAGLPAIDLATLSDGGGGALLRFVRDAWGRLSGTSAATTSDLTEGSNLYFTTTRVLATLLAGLSTATSAAITAADSVLSAFGKLQAQITALTSSLTGYVPTTRTISTTAPLTGGGDLSANRTLAIPAATTSVSGYLTTTDWNTFNNKVPTARTITAGTGLSGGGDLSANRTLTLANTAVTPASYGDATHVATFTVDAQGRLTTAGSVAITAGAVSSVFGRTGAVVAATNDYTFAQIGTKPTTLSGYGITDAQPLDATLTALAGANWALDSLPIGSGADTVAQVNFAANTFPARASTGDLVAKTITDFGLSLVDDANAAAARTTIGLGNVDNTSDANKPVSTAQAAAIALKPGKNKLINANFAINQRGYVSGSATTTANQYTLDRWRVVTSGQSVAFSTSGAGNQVTAPAGGIEQVIESVMIEGGVYTLSWIGTATATVNGTAITNGGQTASLPALTGVTIRFTGGTVSVAQFEIGSIASAFELRPFPLELVLCQRYFQTFSTVLGAAFILCAAFTTSGAIGFLYLPVSMRIKPSGTPTGSLKMTPTSTASGTATLSAVSEQIIAVIVTQSGVALSGAGYFAAVGGSQTISLDAEL